MVSAEWEALIPLVEQTLAAVTLDFGYPVYLLRRPRHNAVRRQLIHDPERNLMSTSPLVPLVELLLAPSKLVTADVGISGVPVWVARKRVKCPVRAD